MTAVKLNRREERSDLSRTRMKVKKLGEILCVGLVSPFSKVRDIENGVIVMIRHSCDINI